LLGVSLLLRCALQLSDRTATSRVNFEPRSTIELGIVRLNRGSVRDVERIIKAIKEISPDLSVRQLTVSHPGADDDGLCFFEQPNSEYEVQIESSTGMCPFLIETGESDARVEARSIEEAVATLAQLLHLPL